jgi:predicted transcriptional regulator
MLERLIVSRPRANERSAQAGPSSFGELQSAVMEELWHRGESSVREVTEGLAERGPRPAYTTVLTVMVRLARRGLLSRRRVGRADLYTAAVGREALAAALSREAVDRRQDAHGEAAISAFVERLREGDARDLARLRELLSEEEL